jgi:hypothetical protein
MLATRLAPTWILCFGVLAFALPLASAVLADDPPVPSDELDLGTHNVSKGPNKIDDLPTAAVNGSDKVKGSLCNQTSRGVTDFFFTLKSANQGTVTVKNLSGGTLGTANFSNSSAHVTGLNVSNNVCVNYELEGVSLDATELEAKFVVTPSHQKTVSGTTIEADSLAEFPLDDLSNLARRGSPVLANTAVLMTLQNVDSAKRVNFVDGAVSVPDNSAPSIQAVSVSLSDGTPVAATVTISGMTFTAAVPALPPGSEYDFLVELDAGSLGKGCRADLEATFVP